MATLNQFAYNIRNIARGGQGNSDDEKLNIRQIKFWIQGWRAKGILEQTDYGKNIDPQLVQDLGVVPLTEVDQADSNCPAVEWGCTIKKITIPKLIDFPLNRAVLFIGKIDKRTPFILDSPDVTIFKEATQFGKMRSRASLIGNNVYFRLYGDDAEIEYVNFRGVFENPEQVSKYSAPGCDAKCYDPLVDEYPMPMSLYEYVVKGIMTTELNISMQTINEQLNDARQDKNIGAQPIKG